jgi:class 3 adenylate cyclase
MIAPRYPAVKRQAASGRIRPASDRQAAIVRCSTMREKRDPGTDWDAALTTGSLMTAGGLVAGPVGIAAGALAGVLLKGRKPVIGEDQMSQKYRDIIEDEKTVFDDGAEVENRTKLPPVDDIPLLDRNKWLRIPDVICVYIDMKDSTKLTVGGAAADTASAFQLFTGTAVRLLNAFEAQYIDVRGDGAFGLFDGGQEYRALAAAVTFKTFAAEVAVPAIEKRCSVKVGSHVAIDQRRVLVRRVGLRRTSDRDDRQNEVWAGKPVNMAAKLASLTGDDELLVSKRFYDKITDDRARKSCGCGSGEDKRKVDLWTEVDLSKDDRFDFDKAFKLSANWCNAHGKAFMEALLRLSE